MPARTGRQAAAAQKWYAAAPWSRSAARRPTARRPPRLDPVAQIDRDLSRILLLRVLGARIVDSRLTRLRWSRLLLVSAILGLPMVGALVWPSPAGITSHEELTYVGWQGYYAALVLSVLLVARHAVGSAASAVPDAVHALTSTGWRHYFAWSERTGNVWHQGVAAVIGGACSTLSVGLLAGTSTRHVLYIGPPSYITVGLAGALAGCAIYWLARGVMLGRLLSGRENFELLWTMPARTPVIEQLSRIFRLGFYVASFAATVYSYPVIWVATRLPHVDNLVIAVKFGYLAAAVVGTLSIGILPQVWVSRTVADARRASIYRAAAAAEETVTATEFNSMAGLLKSIADTPASTINDRTIVGIIFGFAGAVGPVIVQLTFR